MKLADLALPISYADAQQWSLVFDVVLAQRLAELHSLHGRPDCIAVPVTLIDGRLSLPATILTAIEPGGWLHEMWEAADKAVLLPAVEVMPASEADALTPVPTPIG